MTFNEPAQPNFLLHTDLFNENFSAATQTLEYTTKDYLPEGYYVLIPVYVQRDAHAQFTYPSDSYPCPYNPDFIDYHQNFQPC